jgi:hypothetical protein
MSSTERDQGASASIVVFGGQASGITSEQVGLNRARRYFANAGIIATRKPSLRLASDGYCPEGALQMENPLNNQNITLVHDFEASATTKLDVLPEPDPKAPADIEEIDELETRLEDLSTLLDKVSNHVEKEYNKVLDEADDDTDAPHASDEAESSSQVDEAYLLQAQANQILEKEVLSNEDLGKLESIVDRLDSTIEEATPMSFDPSAVPEDDPLRL